MNIRINYGTGVVTVPHAVCGVMERANATDLRVLLLLCADPALQNPAGTADCLSCLAEKAGCTVTQAEMSLAFWRGAGILDFSDIAREELLQESEKKGSNLSAANPETDSSVFASNTARASLTSCREGNRSADSAPSPAADTESKKPLPQNTVPRYTSDEIARLLETRMEARGFIDECANIWGKMFNTHEVNILLGLVDYLGLDWDYVLTLLAFCAGLMDKRGSKRSLRFVEKFAYDLYDDGITALPALQEKLRRMEQMEEVEGQLRRMFGMGERALTPTEKKKFSAWLYEYQYSMEIITRAFEVTVDAKGSPNLKYMDAVLANWNRDGLRTLEEIRAADEKFHAEKSGKKPVSNPSASQNSSFDTNDFFLDAVKRSFGDDFDPSILNK